MRTDERTGREGNHAQNNDEADCSKNASLGVLNSGSSLTVGVPCQVKNGANDSSESGQGVGAVHPINGNIGNVLLISVRVAILCQTVWRLEESAKWRYRVIIPSEETVFRGKRLRIKLHTMSYI